MISKSQLKHADRKREKEMMIMRNMVQLHDEQRSIQITVSHTTHDYRLWKQQH